MKQGDRFGTATVGGRVTTSGDHLTAVEIDGRLDTLTVTGGIHARGRASDAVRICSGGPELSGIEITAADGQSVTRRAE
ncbi:hypothetical protein [Streptomyces sp. NBC_01361]|uniref:hypothetical protein n=1 Tax=Streptomyces sp. NBC_01361 TaxID=2903838 RepID=UPI002E3449F6|nr:hypothetical protein [Streptomyces sp. NBC_01361]